MKRSSFRTRLLLAFLLVVGLVAVVATTSGLSFIRRIVLDEAMRRVEIDLGGAWAALQAEEARLQGLSGMASQSTTLREVLRAERDPQAGCRELEELRRGAEVDFLSLVDAQGRVLARSAGGACAGSSAADDPLVAAALGGRAASGMLVVPRERLLRESEELAERAYVPLVFTERAVPTERSVEDRGLLLEAAMPILDGGQVRGAVYGGILLNRKFALIDGIRNTVFGDRTYAGKPVGTVTVFLGDVRVATNVMLDAGTRALGTRVSREVFRKVLERGERYADRAFVVNDWYLSAYDPIRDPAGRVVGIVYVGLLERAYLEFRAGLARNFLGLSLLGIVLSVGAALYLSAFFRRPLVRLVEATRRLSAGDLAARVEVSRGSRETVELAGAFNAMAEALEAHTRELDRTSIKLQLAYAEAAEKNRAYLEALGFVTHELKSPLASIVFGIGSLRERLLGPLSPAQENALRSVAYSADYLNDTIANYLNLSRLEEGSLSLHARPVELEREVVAPTLERLAELAHERGLRVETSVSPGLTAHCDADRIASVVQNLISNAVKYGRAGGALRVEAVPGPGPCVTLSVWNEGPGFAPADADRLFQKFSRLAQDGGTKSGTGLGLFVSRRIVERHGGRIWAESEPGRWARFSFTLPAASGAAS